MNAIIMAAGLGSRFKEITKTQHKALLPINGVPNLERTIQYLNDANIYEVHILTGYLAENFCYLADKFPGVKLHQNNFYDKYNSLYTFIQGLPYFGESFVIDADTVMAKNIFHSLESSTYLTILRENISMEWCPITNDDGRVIEMKITDERIPSMSGISYWSQIDADKIKQQINLYSSEKFMLDSKLYWDNIPIQLLDKLNIYTELLPKNSLYEMDNEEEYNHIQNIFKR